MLKIELRDLGVSLADRVQNPDKNTLNASNTNQRNDMSSAKMVTKVNPCRDVIDLSSLEVKKLHQNQNKVSLPRKHDGDSKDVIKFVECF